MKMTSLLLAASLVSVALHPTFVRAEDAEAARLSPEIQALMGELLKLRQQSAEVPPDLKATGPEIAAEPTARAPVEPAALAPVPQKNRQPPGSASSLRTSSLKTGSLGTSGLQPASLGGRGPAGESGRRSNENWLLLFQSVWPRR